MSYFTAAQYRSLALWLAAEWPTDGDCESGP